MVRRALVVISALALAWQATAARGNDSVAESVAQALRVRVGRMPVVAVLALNEGTETTDLMLPHALLQRAGAAEVEVVAPRRGTVTLMPALAIEVPQDFAGFARRHPQGADIVIVPALHDSRDPRVLAWLRQQHAQGALMVAICSGALVLAEAGLLDGRRYTGHWYDRRSLGRHPGAVHVPDQRYLLDARVLTSTGVSASAAASLVLVEALAGRAKAQALADELVMVDWGPQHRSDAFGLDAASLWSLSMNTLLFWRHETLVVPVQQGQDDVALALSADAWARSYRTQVVAAAPAPVRLRSGLQLLAAPTEPNAPAIAISPRLDDTLCAIEHRYGPGTRRWVAMQMEYGPGLVSGQRCNLRLAQAQ